jgi:hypothetical protein
MGVDMLHHEARPRSALQTLSRTAVLAAALLLGGLALMGAICAATTNGAIQVCLRR